MKMIEGPMDSDSMMDQRAFSLGRGLMKSNKRRKGKNNPFAIANSQKKKRHMSKDETEDMIMMLKKRFGKH